MAFLNARSSGPPTFLNTPAFPPQSDARPQTRQYLSLRRLNVNELPPHFEFPASAKEGQPTLVQFLKTVISESRQVDFENGFISHGNWSPDGINITMPVRAQAQANTTNTGLSTGTATTNTGPPTGTVVTATKPVPVTVEQRVRATDSAVWLARRSSHLEADVDFAELDGCLAQDHSRNEYRYTPSVFDANELLKWDSSDLDQAADEMRSSIDTRGVEMSVFQMFHRMPKILGLDFLEDRVFHVLVLSWHTSEQIASANSAPESFTIQIPVDIKSLNQVDTIANRNHVKQQGSSQRYRFASFADNRALEPTDLQKERNGKKLTEGNYVSLERLCAARANDRKLRWDMMTLSDAGGITRWAPGGKKRKEILDAIATDVSYVIKQIALDRQSQAINLTSAATNAGQTTTETPDSARRV